MTLNFDLVTQKSAFMSDPKCISTATLVKIRYHVNNVPGCMHATAGQKHYNYGTINHIGYTKSPIGEAPPTCWNRLQLATPTNRCMNWHYI